MYYASVTRALCPSAASYAHISSEPSTGAYFAFDSTSYVCNCVLAEACFSQRRKWEWIGEQRKDGGQREGPLKRGHRGQKEKGGWGGVSHQSCVWWLEIRDRIARGDCSLPKVCVCVCACVKGGSSPQGLSLGAAFLICHLLYGPFESTVYTLCALLPIVPNVLWRILQYTLHSAAGTVINNYSLPYWITK